MDEERPLPESLLDIANQSQQKKRGKLKIYLGAMPGVGKTYTMLSDAQIKQKEGIDIKIGFIETHGRKETEILLEGLYIIPPIEINYNGIILKELNLEKILESKMQICVIDELPHSNPPGFRNKKRYQDIEEILENGIEVWTAMNIQHMESLNNIIYQITGIPIKETVPDEFIKNANEIKLIDLPPEELIQRLKEGKIYIPDLAKTAVNNFFKYGNIIALRELSMRIAADKLDKKLNQYMKEHAIAGPWSTKERILVGIYASPFADSLIRSAYRISSEIGADVFAIYVETEKHQYLSQKELDWLQKAIELARSLGVNVVWVKDTDITNAIVRYVKSNNITKILIGKPKNFNIFKPSIFRKIAQNTKHVDIYVLDPPALKSDLSFLQKKKTFSFIKNLLNIPRFYNIFISLLIFGFVTLLGVEFRQYLNQLNLVFLFLGALSISAMLLNTFLTIVMTILSILVFDYFFIPPYYSFTFSDINYLMSYSMFALIIVYINILSIKSRKNINMLIKSEEKSHFLFSLNKALLYSKSKEEILSKTIEYVKMFTNDIAIFLKSKDDIRLGAITKGIDINEKVNTIVKWCIKNKKPAGFFTQTFYKEPYFYVPLLYKDNVYGVIVFDISSAKIEKNFELMHTLEMVADLLAPNIIHYI